MNSCNCSQINFIAASSLLSKPRPAGNTPSRAVELTVNGDSANVELAQYHFQTFSA